MTFLTLINPVGKPTTFWIYAAFAVVTFFFVLSLVPETKVKRLEDIEDYWEHGRHWGIKAPPDREERICCRMRSHRIWRRSRTARDCTM